MGRRYRLCIPTDAVSAAWSNSTRGFFRSSVTNDTDVSSNYRSVSAKWHEAEKRYPSNTCSVRWSY